MAPCVLRLHPPNEDGLHNRPLRIDAYNGDTGQTLTTVVMPCEIGHDPALPRKEPPAPSCLNCHRVVDLAAPETITVESTGGSYCCGDCYAQHQVAIGTSAAEESGVPPTPNGRLTESQATLAVRILLAQGIKATYQVRGGGGFRLLVPPGHREEARAVLDVAKAMPPEPAEAGPSTESIEPAPVETETAPTAEPIAVDAPPAETVEPPPAPVPAPPIKPFTCPLCQAGSINYQGVVAHLRITHKLDKAQRQAALEQQVAR